MKIPQQEILNFGGNNTPRVVVDLQDSIITNDILAELGYNYLPELDKWNIGDQAPDYLFVTNPPQNVKLPEQLGVIINHNKWKTITDKNKIFPYFKLDEYLTSSHKSEVINFIEIDLDNILKSNFKKLLEEKNIVFVLTTELDGFVEQRRALIELRNMNNKFPVIIKHSYSINSLDEFQLFAATDFGGLFVDGFGDGVWADLNNSEVKISHQVINRIMFGVLQAARVRISKTEYIACPSCGRTLFDLVETTNKIRERTAHLKGVKIGIMGCIVNGPGEMADADYGYVGSGPGKITLYKGKEVIRKNIPAKNAVDELIEIIKENGAWVEPSEKV